MSRFALPYEPQYTAHREAEKRHQDIKQWLQSLEGEESAPPIVPEHSEVASEDQSKELARRWGGA